MGTWSLLSMTPELSPIRRGETFGHNVKVTFRLKYKPSRVGAFVETPLLEWNEKIIMKEHHKKETWVFETNMYEHNPSSKTLRMWAARYVQAYRSAEGRGALFPGSARLLREDGQPVPLRDLPQVRDRGDGRAAAEAVRQYLKGHTSILEIQIHDVPAIGRPVNQRAGEHKERLLLFNVGVRGMGLRMQAQQYLVVNGAQPESQWTGECRRFWSRTSLPAGECKIVPPPTLVSDRRPALFSPGEQW